MKKTILITACLFGLTAVVLGAFGAHGLKQWVTADAVATFETGVRYQMYHAIFLFVLGLLSDTMVRLKKPIYYCTVIGIILFSFSIYALAMNGFVEFDFRMLGILTPIGGVFLIMAWALLGIGILKSKGLE